MHAECSSSVYQHMTIYGYSNDFKGVRQKAIPSHSGRGHRSRRALFEGKVVHIPDVLADSEYTFCGGAESWVAFVRSSMVPMLREGRPIGVLSLTRPEVRPFTDKQIELVKTFAAQAVIAIENARLLASCEHRRSVEALEQQTATADVLKIISSSPGDLEPVFNAMLANATRICEAKFGRVLTRGRCLSCRALHGAPSTYESRRRNRSFHPTDPHPQSAFVANSKPNRWSI